MPRKSDKPKVTVNCVANHYSGPNERIIEFSDKNGNGGLISFATLDDGTLFVSVYNCDKSVAFVGTTVKGK